MPHTDTTWEIAKLKIAEWHRDAERDWAYQEAFRGTRSEAIDGVGFRERLARLFGGFPPLHSNGPRTAGT